MPQLLVRLDIREARIADRGSLGSHGATNVAVEVTEHATADLMLRLAWRSDRGSPDSSIV
jgi:hypothetical protein